MRFLAYMVLLVLPSCGQVSGEVKFARNVTKFTGIEVKVTNIKVPRVLLKEMPNPQLLEKIVANADEVEEINKTILKEDFSIKLVEQYKNLLIEMDSDTEQAIGDFNALSDGGLLQKEKRPYKIISRNFSKYLFWLRITLGDDLDNVHSDLEKLVNSERHHYKLAQIEQEGLALQLPSIKSHGSSIKDKIDNRLRRMRHNYWLTRILLYTSK